MQQKKEKNQYSDDLSSIQTPKSDFTNLCSINQYQQFFQSFSALSISGKKVMLDKKSIMQIQKIIHSQTIDMQKLQSSDEEKEQFECNDISQYKNILIPFKELDDQLTNSNMEQSFLQRQNSFMEKKSSTINAGTNYQPIQFIECKYQEEGFQYVQQTGRSQSNYDNQQQDLDQNQKNIVNQKDLIIQKQMFEIKDLQLKLYWVQKLKKEQIDKYLQNIAQQQQKIKEQQQQVAKLSQDKDIERDQQNQQHEHFKQNSTKEHFYQTSYLQQKPQTNFHTQRI